MDGSLYVKCVRTKENGHKDVCVARIGVHDFERMTDADAENILRGIEREVAKKFGVQPGVLKAEYVPIDEFIKYAGPEQAMMIEALERKMRREREEDKNDTK